MVPRVGDIDGLDVSQFDGPSSTFLDGADLEQVGVGLQGGSVAAVIVDEELSMLPVVRALEDGGARIPSAGSITPDELQAALDGADAV